MSLTSIEEPIIRHLIHFYKYECIEQVSVHIRSIVQKMYSIYGDTFFSLIKPGALFIPAPLHRRRKLWRGYNQSTLLAEIFAEKYSGSIVEPITRTRNTKPQMEQTKEKRSKNLKNAFTLNKRAFEKMPVGQQIILVDDVMTTGATLKEIFTLILAYRNDLDLMALTLAYTPALPHFMGPRLGGALKILNEFGPASRSHDPPIAKRSKKVYTDQKLQIKKCKQNFHSFQKSRR